MASFGDVLTVSCFNFNPWESWLSKLGMLFLETDLFSFAWSWGTVNDFAYCIIFIWYKKPGTQVIVLIFPSLPHSNNCSLLPTQLPKILTTSVLNQLSLVCLTYWSNCKSHLWLPHLKFFKVKSTPFGLSNNIVIWFFPASLAPYCATSSGLHLFNSILAITFYSYSCTCSEYCLL